MLKRLSSLVLLLVLGGSVVAGVPLHRYDDGCQMAGMEMMDCCHKAQMQSDAPEVVTARLCCLLNCTQPLPVEGQFNLRAPAFNVSTPPPAVVRTPLPRPRLLERPASTHIHSRITYLADAHQLRHLIDRLLEKV